MQRQTHYLRSFLLLSSLMLWGVLVACGPVQALDFLAEDDDGQESEQIATATPDPTPTATLTPTETATPTPTPTASPTTVIDDDDAPVIIVIEGPVAAINVNIITIYNFNIAIEPTNPVLQVIQVGDMIRVRGEWKERRHRDDDDDDDDDDFFAGQPIINVTVINIIFINVNVVILDGMIWRDPGDCRGIPGWVTEAEAVDYFRRCFGRGPGGRPSDPGRSSDDDDDDDDDD